MVLASFAEGLPVVMMEAMALGRPVIGTYVAGIPELLEPDICGWLVPPGSVEALTSAMRTVLQLPKNKLEQMGEMGAKRVALEHDVAIEAKKLATLFKQSQPEKLTADASLTSTTTIASQKLTITAK
jgi:glycosyltransferase involved in cell wall biosynthesis